VKGHLKERTSMIHVQLSRLNMLSFIEDSNHNKRDYDRSIRSW